MVAGSVALRVVGLISGTSVDGIDVAVAEFYRDGDQLVLDPLGALEFDYPADLREELHAALPPSGCDAYTLTRLDTLVGQAFAEAADTGVRRLALGRAHLVASLGQTLYHWVERGTALGTLQLGRPAWIAERTGLAVVADLRAADIAAGGHGAPLAATLDALWLRTHAEEAARPVAALNIGGIANLTVVHPDGFVLAYDTGPGNALLDAAAAEVTGGAQRSDLGGALATRGRVRPDLLRRLLAEPYYSLPPPKSTGKEVFHSGYLREATEGLPRVTGPDLLATLTELTAATITAECGRHGVTTVVASGGGLRNPALVRALGRDLNLVPSDELGLPADAKEAYLSALLGWLTWHGLPANLPNATGARGYRLLGSITPGLSPLDLPSPSPPVHRLRVVRNVSTR
ncbi:anhydro-N-acetylmuramic acid kinase [Saccharomonospora amisosensis]|uniref:Anhydro-N-acetylmuramic acid kinase n=1 Tax=Saccharomonospora amisosensis TaxID=1128677 RepID=A0A7X5ZS71_9PSEU|nr:anhydro-N-acetylmuramic acid kinase [Saccharomonospora amisosensis]NIJ13613.1 anhydro-N-acetylmuramic acid kinase [Saccharomonospora amisosensis]